MVDLNKKNTSLREKQENFDKFFELIRNQINHGGDKYKADEKKEFADIICETFPGESGVDYILSTMMKYLGRYKNFGREKDLLKITAYAYMLWLKAGFHEKDFHDEDTKIDS